MQLRNSTSYTYSTQFQITILNTFINTEKTTGAHEMPPTLVITTGTNQKFHSIVSEIKRPDEKYLLKRS